MQWTRANVLGFAVFFYDTQINEICGTKNLGPTDLHTTVSSAHYLGIHNAQNDLRVHI